MAEGEVNTSWQKFMSDFMDANACPDVTFIKLEEYFHLD
jgi:L-rhamnose mutarotase